MVKLNVKWNNKFFQITKKPKKKVAEDVLYYDEVFVKLSTLIARTMSVINSVSV